MMIESYAMRHYAFEQTWKANFPDERRLAVAARLKELAGTAKWAALIAYVRYQRWWHNVAISAVMGVVGWVVVVIIVNHFDTSGVYTRWAVSTVFIIPTYVVHRLLWKDRQTPLKTSGWRWMVLWIVGHADMGSYWLLVHYGGIQYVAAAYINTIPSSIILYRLRDKLAFPKQEETDTGVSSEVDKTSGLTPPSQL